MTYGSISFDVDERALVEELLQDAILKNTTFLAAAQDDAEASFYNGVRPSLQSLLGAVQQSSGTTPFSEEQLGMLKGLLASSYTEFRDIYQKALENALPTLNDLKRQWAIRDGLSAKLDAPFSADTSCDAEEGLFEEEQTEYGRLPDTMP